MPDILTKALEEQDCLMHHGVKGQRWGVRRYQNEDGSLTEEGRKRYLKEGSQERAALDKANARYREASKSYNPLYNRLLINTTNDELYKKLRKIDTFKDIPDDKLRQKVKDTDFRMKGIEEYIRQTKPEIAKEYESAKRDYDSQLDSLYKSVKDRTLRELSSPNADYMVDKLLYGKKRLHRIYQDEYNRMLKQHRKEAKG